ncbi:MAG: adenosylmethionine decarboxylase [Alphaproteobacteria bacterium]|nr:adenosylmethionine decarboxylase [Alphaproteobacteria bacterium]
MTLDAARASGIRRGVGAPRRWQVVEGAKDYFIERDGVRFAGTHLLVDMWDAHDLDDIDVVERSLREAATAAGATILHVHLHHFTPNGGVSGVIVLAESHISIHTWPERGYAALDVFMCGSCDPHLAIPVLRRDFRAGTVRVDERRRGMTS